MKLSMGHSNQNDPMTAFIPSHGPVGVSRGEVGYFPRQPKPEKNLIVFSDALQGVETGPIAPGGTSCFTTINPRLKKPLDIRFKKSSPFIQDTITTNSPLFVSPNARGVYSFYLAWDRGEVPFSINVEPDGARETGLSLGFDRVWRHRLVVQLGTDILFCNKNNYEIDFYVFNRKKGCFRTYRQKSLETKSLSFPGGDYVIGRENLSSESIWSDEVELMIIAGKTPTREKTYRAKWRNDE